MTIKSLQYLLDFLRAAIACLGAMYERLGRMTGRSYEDTVQILIKSLKNAEVSQFCQRIQRAKNTEITRTMKHKKVLSFCASVRIMILE